MTFEEAKDVFLNRGFVNGIFDGDKWRESVAVISKWLEQEPCEDCCNGNQIEKAKLCQKSYLAGMEHKQEPVLGKIKDEIKEWYWQVDKQALAKDPCVVDAMVDLFIRTLDKHKAESEEKI